MKPYGAKPFVGSWRDHRRKHWVHRIESDTPTARCRENRSVPLVRREFVWGGREEYPVSTYFSQHSQAPYQAGQDDWWDDFG